MWILIRELSCGVRKVSARCGWGIDCLVVASSDGGETGTVPAELLRKCGTRDPVLSLEILVTVQ